MAVTVTVDRLRAAGLSIELAVLVVELARLAHKEPRSGKDGRGISDSAFDAVTGQLTLTLSDGSTVVTSDLRGRDLSGEVAALLVEIAAARGSHATLSERQHVFETIASANAGGVIPGRYYDNAFMATTSTNAAGGNNRVEMAPFVASRRLLIDRIGVSIVTGVADATGRCFIYGTGPDGWPDELLWEASGNLDQSASGFAEHTLPEPLEFLPGVMYWLGHRHAVNAATLRGVALSSCLSLGPINSASNLYASQLRRVITFATPLPANWGFAEGDLTGNAPPPAIRMRAI